MLQNLLVACLVFACALYATWTLLPAAARRWLASRLLRWRVPSVMVGPLQRASRASTGCQCDGCDSAGAGKPAAGPQPIRFQRRPLR